MAKYNGELALEKGRELVARSRRVGTNVTLYTGPELGRLADSVGQRNIFGGHNWDTRVRNRSAKYTVVLGSEKVVTKNPLPEQAETIAAMDREFTRVFGGDFDGKVHRLLHETLVGNHAVHHSPGHCFLGGNDISGET